MEATAIPVTLPDTKEIEVETSTVVSSAQAFTVSTREDAEVVSIRVKGISELRKKIEAHHKPIKQSIDAAKKVVLDQEKKLLAPLDSAEAIYKAKYAKWYGEEQERQRQERLRLEAEARKKEEDRMLAEAAALQKAGRKDEARALLEEPPPDIQVKMPDAEPVKGLSPTRSWKAEVTDLHKLICAIAEDKSFVNLVGPMMVELNALARATKGAIALPGVRFFQEVSVSRR